MPDEAIQHDQQTQSLSLSFCGGTRDTHQGSIPWYSDCNGFSQPGETGATETSLKTKFRQQRLASAYEFGKTGVPIWKHLQLMRMKKVLPALKWTSGGRLRHTSEAGTGLRPKVTRCQRRLPRLNQMS
jgi:hypothetical protein